MKGLRKTGLPVLVLVALCLIATTAFAGGTTENPKSGETASVRLVSERGSHTEAWKTRMEGFEAETGIDLEITQFPYANYFDQLMLQFTGGDVEFDVPYISLLWYPALAKSGYIQPLNELLAMDPGLKQDMPGLAAATLDGNLYMVPYMNEVGGVVYRTDLFGDPAEKKNFKAKYGYELSPPKTLEQYRDLAEFFNRPPDLYGVTLMGKRSIFLATHFMNRLWARGGSLLDDEMEPAFAGRTGVEALEEMAGMFEFANPAALNYDFQDANTEFKQGKSAMAELWTTAMFHASDPESSQVVGKVSFVGFPKPANALDEKRPRLFISWGFSVASAAQNKDAALEWIRYVIEPKNLAEAAPLGTIPPRLSAMNDPELLSKLPWIPAFQEALGSCIPTPIVPLIPEGMTIVNQFIAPAVSEFLTGNATAQAALSDAAKKTHDLLEENGYYK
jgi:multiple sugar transport system substrate-binding protein